MSGANTIGSADRFGYEWDRYATILPEYEEQFRRWLPFYDAKDWQDKRFVDVGCGMGRNSYWPMKYGAAGGVAMDLDERSLRAARRNLSAFPAVQVVQASAYSIPSRDEFDIAFSIGVIHHLEDPAGALRSMTMAVRPGGEVAIWVYGRQNMGWLLWVLQPARKFLFSRLPVDWVHSVSVVPAALLWLVLRLGFGEIQYFRLLRSFSFAHLRSIVFDQMLPKIAHYWTYTEVEALMRGCGLVEVEVVEVNEMSWAAKGKKPGAEPPVQGDASN